MLTTWLILSLTVLLFASLLELRRTRELHHGYLGLALIVYASVCACLGYATAVRWIGIAFLADDDVQHVWEALCKLLGRPIPADFTIVHRLGDHLLAFIENCWHNLLALFRHHDGVTSVPVESGGTVGGSPGTATVPKAQ